MCVKSTKGRIHPGDTDSQRHITKVLVVLLPAPHVRKVSQGENASRWCWLSVSHNEGISGAVTSSTCAWSPPRWEYIQATLILSISDAVTSSTCVQSQPRGHPYHILDVVLLFLIGACLGVTIVWLTGSLKQTSSQFWSASPSCHHRSQPALYRLAHQDGSAKLMLLHNLCTMFVTLVSGRSLTTVRMWSTPWPLIKAHIWFYPLMDSEKEVYDGLVHIMSMSDTPRVRRQLTRQFKGHDASFMRCITHALMALGLRESHYGRCCCFRDQ